MAQKEKKSPIALLIQAYALCLEAGEAAALISTKGNLSYISSLRRRAKEWIQEADENLSSFSPAEALEIADARSFIYRLAYNSAPFPGSADSQLLHALDAAIKGDPEVDQYLLHRLLSARIRAKAPQFLGRAAHWEALRLDRWYRQAKAEIEEGRAVPSQTLHRIKETAILLETDLYDFEPRSQECFKQQLLQTRRSLLNLPKELIAESALISQKASSIENSSPQEISEEKEIYEKIKYLRALRHLLFCASPFLPEEEYERRKEETEASLRQLVRSCPIVAKSNKTQPSLNEETHPIRHRI